MEFLHNVFGRPQMVVCNTGHFIPRSEMALGDKGWCIEERRIVQLLSGLSTPIWIRSKEIVGIAFLSIMVQSSLLPCVKPLLDIEIVSLRE
jgi:hypothetical protein